MNHHNIGYIMVDLKCNKFVYIFILSYNHHNIYIYQIYIMMSVLFWLIFFNYIIFDIKNQFNFL